MKKRSVINPFLAVCLILIAHTAILKTGRAEDQITVNIPNLSGHPIYSKYRFDNTENVINFGSQPFFSPTGLITEVMKRDTVLHSSLSEAGIEVRFYAFLKGNDVNYFLRKGDIDLGIGGDMPTITAAATMDITVSSIIQQGFCSVVARRSMLIR